MCIEYIHFVKPRVSQETAFLVENFSIARLVRKSGRRASERPAHKSFPHSFPQVWKTFVENLSDCGKLCGKLLWKTLSLWKMWKTFPQLLWKSGAEKERCGKLCGKCGKVFPKSCGKVGVWKVLGKTLWKTPESFPHWLWKTLWISKSYWVQFQSIQCVQHQQ